jgi:transposase InsO family protein
MIEREGSKFVFCKNSSNHYFIEILDLQMNGTYLDRKLTPKRISRAERQRRGIKLFILLPRSPKLNGHVKRAQRTHTEEFYEVTDTSFEIAELNRALLEWERVNNTVRPHQALGYLTIREFLKLYKQNKRRNEYH